MLTAMAETTGAHVLGSVTLVTGGEEFLAERSIASLTAAVRAAAPDADLAEIEATELTTGALAELTSPSLFAAVRAVVVRNLQDAPDAAADPVLSYAAAPAADVALVLVHSGGQKGKALLDRLRRIPGVSEQRCDSPKPWDLPQFVLAEARRSGTKLNADCATALVDSVGTDLRALAAAVDQLGSDCAGEPITVPVIRRYFGGRAEVKGFAVADAAIAGRTGDALEQLRWALTNGVAPVLVTSAFATGLRDLGRYRSAPMGLREADLAREVGVAPWKLKGLRRQAPGWEPDALAAAIGAVAKADADIKGAAENPEYTLERLVLTVTGGRTSRAPGR